PGQSGFSLNDLAVFTINNSIKTMTIVTNKGRIKFISKTERFKEKVMKKMIANLLIEKSLDVISTKDIEKLLKELYNNDNIIYRNR
ncbi:TPA: phage head morphogenesis protein, partial [Staphylococcus aureus]|nr:phage head morphogenesis protein [Staphylococcus aureus]